MTDKEILEAVQNCANGCAKKCPYDENTLDYEKCMSDLMRDALDLINRQQAEIERLKKGNKILEYKNDVLIFNNKRMDNEIAELTVEKKVVEDNAIKQFVEKLKEEMNFLTKFYNGKRYYFLVSEKFIDKVVKEMAGTE